MRINGGDEIPGKLPDFGRMASDAARDPASLEVSIFGMRAQPAELAKARDAGVARVILGLAPESAEKILPALDRYAAPVHRVGSGQSSLRKREASRRRAEPIASGG